MRMERKTVRGHLLEYRRYSESGTGPEKGHYRVGDTITKTNVKVDYIVTETSYGTFRDHVTSVTGVPFECEIIAITQRRKGYEGRGWWYYDSWFKLQTKGGNVFWSSAAKKHHIYRKLGSVNLVDEINDALWNQLDNDAKMEYLEYQATGISLEAYTEALIGGGLPG